MIHLAWLMRALTFALGAEFHPCTLYMMQNTGYLYRSAAKERPSSKRVSLLLAQFSV